ncbi:hypothetical protein EV421DRAFT_285428 [Armillaria borealis]|uniref:Uncharacterized protein n=1 Tax=Armillaria borealis TaxID=47425 RepID=A0AA39JSE6_9AGAR|nr:hypothetical protein EV421DRAFT_285428 [Armillaria borealis]
MHIYRNRYLLILVMLIATIIFGEGPLCQWPSTSPLLLGNEIIKDHFVGRITLYMYIFGLILGLYRHLLMNGPWHSGGIVTDSGRSSCRSLTAGSTCAFSREQGSRGRPDVIIRRWPK